MTGIVFYNNIYLEEYIVKLELNMSITAKELSKILGLSPSAISIALNNKPGVSEETRKLVQQAAKEHGYKSNVRAKGANQRTITFVLYKKQGGAVVDDTPFFSSLTEGIAISCNKHGFSLDIRYLFESNGIVSEIKSLLSHNPTGIILLATEMTADDFKPFSDIEIPLVVLDAYFDTVQKDYVLINNIQGAFLAADTLIKSRQSQPGYLRSSYPISNFNERADGFYKAIRSNGLSTSKSPVHYLSPSVDGAYSDMTKLLDEKVEIADSYFADNDLIAVGAMRAFIEHGYKIPEDVAFVGFDNTYICTSTTPQLTAINVPKQAMGQLAVERLVAIISGNSIVPVKTELSTSLVNRYSL